MQQCVYGTKSYDIYDLQKCLTQTWVDFEQNVIEAAIDQWRDSLRYHVCVLVADTLNTCREIIVYLYMWFMGTFCETVNVIWCIWRLFYS